MAETVFAVIMFAAAAGLSVTAVRQLRCKGRCLNNADIWASEEERKNTDYKPYYKQSGTVFLMIAAMAVLEGLYILLKSRWFMIGGILLLTAMTVYAVGSSVRIEKNRKDNK